MKRGAGGASSSTSAFGLLVLKSRRYNLLRTLRCRGSKCFGGAMEDERVSIFISLAELKILSSSSDSRLGNKLQLMGPPRKSQKLADENSASMIHAVTGNNSLVYHLYQSPKQIGQLRLRSHNLTIRNAYAPVTHLNDYPSTNSSPPAWTASSPFSSTNSPPGRSHAG